MSVMLGPTLASSVVQAALGFHTFFVTQSYLGISLYKDPYPYLIERDPDPAPRSISISRDQKWNRTTTLVS